ncbi:MAG: hypothetical protein HFJ73_03570 [Eggerthellaceae bacterium]|jgi:hypothetical protein|nr:hypothetical protein [Eggerthellaceae bacterium]
MNATNGSKIQAQPKDITTIGQALAGCDPSLLMECMLELEAGPRYSTQAITEVMRYAFTRRVADDLDEVGRCATACAQGDGEAPDGCAEEPLPGIIIPIEWYEVEDACGMIRHRLGAALLGAEAAERADEVLERSGGYAYELAEVYAAERLVPDIGSMQPWTWDGLRASSCWFATEPWESIVQTRVWLPEALQPKERYFVLAHVLWMMTQRGLDASVAVEGLREANREAQLNRCTPAPRRMLEQVWCGAGADRLFGGEMPEFGLYGLSPFEESYVQRLSNIVKLLNYNCWVDALEACAALRE